MSKCIDLVLEHLEIHHIELTSYGLAPNPNGFCYALADSAMEHEKDEYNLTSLYLGTVLSNLTASQEVELIERYFR